LRSESEGGEEEIFFDSTLRFAWVFKVSLLLDFFDVFFYFNSTLAPAASNPAPEQSTVRGKLHK